MNIENLLIQQGFMEWNKQIEEDKTMLMTDNAHSIYVNKSSADGFERIATKKFIEIQVI